MTTLRDEVVELFTAYNEALDSRDADTWARLFAPEGVYRRASKPELAGREALYQHLAHRPQESSVHITTNVSVRFAAGDSDDRFHVVSTYVAADRDSESLVPGITVVGLYRDTLRRHEGRLVFEERDISMLVAPAS